jgi:hypothetical protein
MPLVEAEKKSSRRGESFTSSRFETRTENEIFCGCPCVVVRGGGAHGGWTIAVAPLYRGLKLCWPLRAASLSR